MSEKFEPMQVGLAEWNGIFWLFQFSGMAVHLRVIPKILKFYSGKCLFNLILSPKFPKILVEWKTSLVCHNSCEHIKQEKLFTKYHPLSSI